MTSRARKPTPSPRRVEGSREAWLSLRITSTAAAPRGAEEDHRLLVVVEEGAEVEVGAGVHQLWKHLEEVGVVVGLHQAGAEAEAEEGLLQRGWGASVQQRIHLHPQQQV